MTKCLHWSATSVVAVACSVVLAGAAPFRQAAPSCRTYDVADTRALTAGGGESQTCNFNSTTFVYTCTLDIGIQVARHVTSVRQYASVADFVDEIRVIPPISRALSGSTTYSPGGAGAADAKLTFDYDAQRRQTDMLQRFTDGRVIKTTFTAWDPSGRPLAHTTNGQSFKFGYDDKARTMSIAGPGGTQTHTFDENGNLIKEMDVTAAGQSNTTFVTIQKTAKVCR